MKTIRFKGAAAQAVFDALTKPDVNPWQPMRKPLDLKALGKLGEECGELSAAICHCVIQGIEEREPVTGKANRAWLEEEIADVLANIDIVIEHFDLDAKAIYARQLVKQKKLRAWHAMMEPEEPL